ncbi:hypothetical protein EDD85DRAFT_792354 [Armillaria nabsnona]|nr:hypothetical protein EDD85DRAFT_792354 [Armillaria nabsnona]
MNSRKCEDRILPREDDDHRVLVVEGKTSSSFSTVTRGKLYRSGGGQRVRKRARGTWGRRREDDHRRVGNGQRVVVPRGAGCRSEEGLKVIVVIEETATRMMLGLQFVYIFGITGDKIKNRLALLSTEVGKSESRQTRIRTVRCIVTQVRRVMRAMGISFRSDTKARDHMELWRLTRANKKSTYLIMLYRIYTCSESLVVNFEASGVANRMINAYTSPIQVLNTSRASLEIYT